MASRKSPEEKQEARVNELEIAFGNLEMDGEPITAKMLADAMNVTPRTIWRRIKEHGGFKTEKVEGEKESFITRKDP